MRECTFAVAASDGCHIVWLGVNKEVLERGATIDSMFLGSGLPNVNNGGSLGCAPAFAIRADGGLDMVGITSDDQEACYRGFVTGTGYVPAQGFMRVGGKFLAPISIVIPKTTRIDLFGVGLDHQLYRNYKDGKTASWSGWALEGGHFHSSVGAISRADGYYDVVGINAFFGVSYKLLESSRSRLWESLGGKFKSQAVIVAASAYTVHILGLDISNRILHKYGTTESAGGLMTWTPAGKDWTDLGGGFDSPPAAVSCSPGRLDVFATKLDKTLWRNTFSNDRWQSTSEWTDTKGILTGAPAAVSRASQKIDVFGQYEGQIWCMMFQNGTWGSWNQITGVVKETADFNGFPPPYVSDWS